MRTMAWTRGMRERHVRHATSGSPHGRSSSMQSSSPGSCQPAPGALWIARRSTCGWSKELSTAVAGRPSRFGARFLLPMWAVWRAFARQRTRAKARHCAFLAPQQSFETESDSGVADLVDGLAAVVDEGAGQVAGDAEDGVAQEEGVDVADAALDDAFLDVAGGVGDGHVLAPAQD